MAMRCKILKYKGSLSLTRTTSQDTTTIETGFQQQG